MNKNNINFQVHRTTEGTVCEIICGLLLLISFIFSIVMLTKTPQGGGAMLMQTLPTAIAATLCLVLVYQPNNFNIPDDSPAELFVATIRFVRLTAVLISVLSLVVTLGTFFGFDPVPLIAVIGLLLVPLIGWYFHIYIKAKYKK